ncbi:UNVERIFIED_CONTAM: hypothetical protein FKN15_054155 [Acipenser sinensis]
MASHVTTAGGFVIVTHKYPLSNAGQAAPGTVASQLPGPLQTFLQGQPKALGVKACLGMNVVSSVFAGVGSILCSISVSIVSFQMVYFNTSLYVGILAVLLVLNILEMCIAIATSAFGCKSECRYIAMRGAVQSVCVSMTAGQCRAFVELGYLLLQRGEGMTSDDGCLIGSLKQML